MRPEGKDRGSPREPSGARRGGLRRDAPDRLAKTALGAVLADRSAFRIWKSVFSWLIIVVIIAYVVGMGGAFALKDNG
ncbi:hypothetical protein [Aureimonas pseudogalii]|uniref:Uncharacterized protein n=1 Tax=Aureimonas pseudogalii TaxID=1744844 RepID=A0A7W6MME1_9HYPH|nr:hypothetical protein [Aureimonas pseudogalii]MBB4000752.1 hypothetical protein [Aureimonas pseudogalii]